MTETVREHFVITSADADRLPDGSLRVRLLRPLQRVKSLRLLYAELPKTVKTLDLLIELSVQGGKLMTMQTARAFRANENSDPQIQHFGRLHIEDFGVTGAFIENVVQQAAAAGIIPRYVFENLNPAYMRFDFLPALPTLNTLQLSLRIADARLNNALSTYIPDLTAVTYGHHFVEEAFTLEGASALGDLRLLLSQGAGTTLRKATKVEAATISSIDFLTYKDKAHLGGWDGIDDNLTGLQEITGYVAFMASGVQTLLQPIVQCFLNAYSAAPATQAAVGDTADLKRDDVGVIVSPIVYTLPGFSIALREFLLAVYPSSPQLPKPAHLLPLGYMRKFQWLTRAECQAPDNKPAFPVAFNVDDYDPGESLLEENVIDRRNEEIALGRVIIELSPEVEALLPSEDDMAMRRAILKTLLCKSIIRTAPQRRLIQGTDNQYAHTIQMYEVEDVFDLDPGLATKYRTDVLTTTGQNIDNKKLYAVLLERNCDPFLDPEFLRMRGTQADLLFLNNVYRLDSGEGFSISWEVQSLFMATFPYSLTFETEMEV